MSSSERRLAANRANALRSTGPSTATGKVAASLNATRHGLLSTQLLLDDESADDFDELLLDLQSALAPVGCMELALVERIAVGLWRQRRLITAETAAIRLSREPIKISAGVNRELALSYSKEIKEDDLRPFDMESVDFCNAVISEVEKLDQLELADLLKRAPTLFEQLRSDAEDDEKSVEDYLQSQEEGVVGYVGLLLEWCHAQLKAAEKRPNILQVADRVREWRLVLPDNALQIFSRYQTTLDNQLFKTLKALREAQEWRLKTLGDVVPDLPATRTEAA